MNGSCQTLICVVFTTVYVTIAIVQIFIKYNHLKGTIVLHFHSSQTEWDDVILSFPAP